MEFDGRGNGTTHDHLMRSQIVGIAVGSVVGCLLIVLLVFSALCYCLRCRQVGLIGAQIVHCDYS